MSSSHRWYSRWIALGGVAVFASACVDAPVETPMADGPNFSQSGAQAWDVSDRHLVRFKGKGVPSSFGSDVEALGGTVDWSHEEGFALVSGLSAGDAAGLEGGKVAEVRADMTFQLDAITDLDVVSVEGEPASTADPSTAFFFARQWNMRAVAADVAWAAGRTGSAGVTIAILDSGIDYTYPDLAGLVDLSRSVSFVPGDDAFVDLFFPGAHHIADLFFHGTHVAMTAASHSNILAGVTSQTTLMGVKVCDVFGSCSFGAIVAGLLHSVDNGADVINMSLGGAFTKAGANGFGGFVNSLFNHVRSAGVTIVVSAGNAASDLDHNGNTYATYCDTPAVICVSATGPTSSVGTNGPWTDVDAPAGYSNFGRSAINVAAPGGTGPGGGWVWSGCSRFSLVIPVCQTGVFILGSNGTSMSSPHVSGLAALLVEDVGRRPGRIRSRIQQSADDLGQNGTDPNYGKGRINVGAAIN